MAAKQNKTMKAYMEEALSIIGNTVAIWEEDNSGAVLANRVKRQLDERQEKIVCQLLGFKEHWGKWEVDNCNGRSGNSAAGDYLREVQKEAIQEWFESIQLPNMPPAMAKSLKSEYLETLRYKVRDSLSRIAQQKADEIANKMIEECLNDEGAAQNYFKLIALLEQTNNQQS